MFSIGDKVIYGTQGVCIIDDITVQKFLQKKCKYYVLKPAYQQEAKIFVPMENEMLTKKMRRVLSPEEIKTLIKEMPDQETIWIEDEGLRKEKYKQIIAEGDRTKLVKLIKTLYAKQKEKQENGRKLHQSDERFLKEAEKLLHNEFAAVLKIRQEDVLPFIMNEMNIL